MTDLPFPLVSTEWLAANLPAPDLRVIDASWRMPGLPPARLDYDQRRIRGAAFFDLDEIADRSTGLPHMLPSREQFSDAVGACGISSEDRVVVYDDAGVFSAARVWWTFRAHGHEKVSVLDGGLPKWLREGREAVPGGDLRAPALYTPKGSRRLARTDEDVRRALADDTMLILDARPSSRFEADAPEPRPGLRRGHMPGARNIPHTDLLAADGTMKSRSELRAIFLAAGYSDGKPVITTCGSGVTAAVLALALERIGAADVGLYDGSWAEWGRETNDLARYPVEAGAR